MLIRIKKIVLGNRVTGSPVMFAFRTLIMARLLSRHVRALLRWLFMSREFTNFTYGLIDINQRELTEFLHTLTGEDRDTIRDYVEELLTDATLKTTLENKARQRPPGAGVDRGIEYGNRIGWYVLARIYKPAVIVEAGVDRGAGSSVLAAAAIKNGEDGARGEVYAFDIDPEAGQLIDEPFESKISRQSGDSLALLQELDMPVGLFIYDAGADYDRETASYRLIHERAMTKPSVILSKTSHHSTALMDFAEAIGRPYYQWRERPLNHIFPGTGFGIVILEPSTDG